MLVKDTIASVKLRSEVGTRHANLKLNELPARHFPFQSTYFIREVQFSLLMSKN